MNPSISPFLEEPLPFSRLELPHLLELARDPELVSWDAYLPGVDIHRLYGDGVSGPTAALIRFRTDATIPRHRHPGYEHLLVLAGSQSDQNGVTRVGSLVVNPPGTEHVVHGQAGCIVLAIYQEAVVFR